MAARKDADVQPDRTPLRALIVEDNPRDVKLLAANLQASYVLSYEAVDSLDLLQSKLEMGQYDVIISDYTLKGWNAIHALEIVKNSGKDIPLIVVTGTLGDVAAANCIKQGAADYILKDRMARLPDAIQRALEDKALRQSKKRSELALRRSNTILEGLIENAPVAIILIDGSGKILRVNAAAVECFGYSRDEMLNQTVELLIPERLRAMHRVQRAEYSARPKVRRHSSGLDLRGKKKDGSEFPADILLNPIFTEDGQVVLAFVIDTTDRKRGEEELRASEDRYRDLVEHSRDLICTHDLKGRLLSVNPEPARILGYTPNELLETEMRDLLAPEARGKFDEYLTNIQRDGAAQGLMVVQTRNGEKRIWEYNNTLRTEGVEEPVVRGMARDVTERKNAENALAQRSRAAFFSADVGSAITQGENLTDTLQLCAEAMVRHLHASFARIWILNTEGNVLELQASAGKYTHLDGLHSRVPVGQLKIGRIAKEGLPHLTNDVMHDPQVGDREWAEREGMVAFAGYPLLVNHQVLGVAAMFARQKLSPLTLEALATVADGIALRVQRERAEVALRESENRYRLLFEGNPAPMWVYDLFSLRFLAVNEAAISHYGYSRDEFLSMTIRDIRPPEDVPALLKAIVIGKEGLDHSGGWRHLKKDGTQIDVEIISHPITFGGYRAELVLVKDVTEQKLAAEAVRFSEGKFRTAFDSNPEPVTISTITEGRYLDVNQSYLRVTGFGREEAIGRTAFELGFWVTPDDRRKFVEEIERKGRVDAMEVNFRTKSGQTRVGLISAEKIELGNLNCVLSVTKDITERKDLEQQFRQSQKMEAVGKLAGGVAHDFNNILTVINGYAELMHGQLQPGTHWNYLSEIRKAGERAAALTRQLLAFSRQQVLAPQVLNLNRVIENMHSMLTRLIGEDIDLVTIAGKDLGHVKADPGQIEQVLLNLAVNARDAMPQGGKLTIETANVELDEAYASKHVTAKPGPHVMLAVSDTGIGMDAKTQKLIFEPFFTTKEKGKGTGLGLSTVYGIVKQSEGQIWVYSESGHGTTFKIYLPRVDMPADLTVPEPGISGLLQGTETILMVEDEPSVRTLVQTSLESSGYTVLTATNGIEALIQAGQYEGIIHLMVTDLVMPEMGGRSLAEQMATMRPETKVIYMSGYTDDAVVRHGGLGPGMAFLQKPFTPDSLLRKVREVLGAR